MKKVYLLSILAIVAFAVVALSSCNPFVPNNPNNGGGGSNQTAISTTLEYVRNNATTLEGTTVTVEGTVICAPGEVAPWWAYIQNGSYGVLVDGDNTSSDFTSLKRGDKVKVTGVVDIPSHGYVEVGNYDSAAQVEKLGTAATPTPAVVTINDLKTNEDIQGTLIKLKDVSLYNSSQWPAEGTETNVTIKDTTGATVTMHIDKDTDIDGSPTPTGTFTVIGVAAYYNVPQILPRNLDDIVTK
jgi:uncharacterized protein YdeI (BOF family)